MGGMTLEYLAEQKTKYQNKADYFKSIGFDNLDSDFRSMVDLITKMEECIKENSNEEDKAN